MNARNKETMRSSDGQSISKYFYQAQAHVELQDDKIDRKQDSELCWLSGHIQRAYPLSSEKTQVRTVVFPTVFARDSIYAKRAYAIAIPSVCLSVCLSVRLSVTRVIHAKTVVVRIVQFSPYSSPIPLVFAR